MRHEALDRDRVRCEARRLSDNPDPPMSADRRWYWDGTKWIAAPARRKVPRWVVYGAVAWLVCLTAWIPPLVAILNHDDSQTRVTAVLLPLGSLAAVSTIAFGVALGSRQLWAYLWWSALIGTVASAVVLSVALASSQPQLGPASFGIGFGVLVLAAPLAPVVAALLWLGGVVGRGVQRARS
jgi:hypothetical protein